MVAEGSKDVANRDAQVMKIALFFSGLAGGGAQRRMLTLARGLQTHAHAVTLLPVRPEGPFREQIPRGVETVALGGAWTHWRLFRTRRSLTVMASLVSLVRHLRRARPDVLLSASDSANFTAIAASILAGGTVPIIPTVNIDHRAALARRGLVQRGLFAAISRLAYRRADAVITISEGLNRTVRDFTGLPPERVITVYNPVDLGQIAALARQPVDHPWLADQGVPLLLAVGKLKPQKDYPTLLHAVVRVREMRPVRLLVLGEGELRGRLEALAAELGITPAVAFLGFVVNPFAYMARARVLVHASAWEGLSNTLLEALACGCPVVSTDCPSGPREVLEGGRHGRLVPVGDDRAMADAILATLDEPPTPERQRARAAAFSVERAIGGYLRVIQQVIAGRQARAHGATPVSGASR